MADILKLISSVHALRAGELCENYGNSFFRNPSEIWREGVIIGERKGANRST